MLPFTTSLRASRKLSPSPDPKRMAAPPSTPLHIRESSTSPAPTPEHDAEPDSSSHHHLNPKPRRGRLPRIAFLQHARHQPEHDADELVVHVSPLEALRAAFNPFHVKLILTNTGSVARDHLALERTFLAYVRTSLAIASAGVGACSPLHDAEPPN